MHIFVHTKKSGGHRCASRMRSDSQAANTWAAWTWNPEVFLPQGTSFPKLSDLASLAKFLMEADPRMKDALAHLTDMSNRTV